MLPHQLLFVAIVFLESQLFVVRGLSCTADAFTVSRSNAIRDTYCYNDDVYSGRVMAATCNCLPDSSKMTANCQHYQLDLDNSVISTRLLAVGVCDTLELDNRLQSCATLGNSLVSWGFRVEGVSGAANVSTRNLSSGRLGCDFSCPFNFAIEHAEMQPCIYTVKVGEVFKGNYSSGDVIEVVGPNVQFTNFDRVLQVNTDYLAGVGGLCNPINEWSLKNTFSEEEFKLLRRNITCGQFPIAPSLISIAPPLVSLVLSLLPFLYIS